MTLDEYLEKVYRFIVGQIRDGEIDVFPMVANECKIYHKVGIPVEKACEKILEDIRESNLEEWEKPVYVVGKRVYVDHSGVGHAWRPARNIDAGYDIQEEIAGMISDGGNETCKDFVAGNGVHYRW